VDQLGDVDRIATAIAISQDAYPTQLIGLGASTDAGAVVLARADEFADALVGTPLAVKNHAPMLLTGSASLDPRTKAEIVRLLGGTGTLYLLGGLGALDQAVTDELESAGFTVVRFAGADRYATAVAVAEQGLGSPATVLEATGTNFPDALAAGAAAAHSNAAVLLTNGTTQADATAAYLTTHGVTNRFGVGGAAAAADPQATPLVGADRYETSSKVAQAFFTDPSAVGLASGTTFPDALTGGAHIGARGGPMLLTQPTVLPSVISAYLATNKNTIDDAFIYGGSSAVVHAVIESVNIALQ
jgi:putative cell wall-binding protein